MSPEINSQTELEIEKERENHNLNKIEAALFISGRWLSLQELIMLTDINPILLKQLLEKLNNKYSNMNTALDILSKENSWKMDVKSEHTDMINKFATGSSEFTKAEQETLAVIAYKQPIKQSVIVKIRGNKSYEHIRKFVQLGLLKSKKLGRTKELNLSEEFYDYFHVQNKESSDNSLNIEKKSDLKK
ncbi:MAG: SMC-Scp complex subunit ScpB [Nanoarchaeota archaeon]|nr:SMC-Scp complex subunit ScpB [Nanoarchaeota archaeon]